MNDHTIDVQKEKGEREIENQFIKTSGNRISSWFANTKNQSIKYDKITDNDSTDGISVDVIIIGGGIAGLTTAYLLSKMNKTIAVVEDGFIASGETSRTTAHITHALDDRYYNIERIHGIEGARIVAESHTKAIELVESIVNEEKIDCEFERLSGYLFLDPTGNINSLHKEIDATHKAGIKETEIIQRAPLTSFNTGPCIKFPNQAQFHPLKYLQGLAEAIILNGGKIFTETHAEEIKSNSITTSEGHSINAKKIIIATNAPIIDKVSKIYEKQEAYRTYVIGAKIKKNLIPKALYWDTGNHNSDNAVYPYHYVRIQTIEDNNSDYDILIVGGEDHKTGNAFDIDKRYANLESWTRERFPIEDIEYRWSGQVMEPKDSMAFIGKNPSNQNNNNNSNNNTFIATGDSGNGITHGTIAGIILADLIMERENSWSSLYDPSRKIKTNFSNKQEQEQKDEKEKEKPVKETKDEEKYSSSTNESENTSRKLITQLSNGEGTIIEDNNDNENNNNQGNPLAVYKDNNGNLHIYSAVCTHMGCTLTWNQSELSFDCPCHGSRFSAESGKVINAPANQNWKKNKLNLAGCYYPSILSILVLKNKYNYLLYFGFKGASII